MMNKNELEQIITLGYIEKDFKILNFKVKMRTLSGNEIWTIMKETSGYDDLTKLVGTQIKTLVYSIVSINDKKIEYIPESDEDNITEQKKYIQNENIISKWQKYIIDLFYEKYTELRMEQQNFLSESQISSEKSGQEKNGK